MRLVIISDTHSQHHDLKLPEGDILIHAGDFSMLGKYDEVHDFIKWFTSQPHKHKIFIAGNHDKSFDPKFNPEPNLFHDTPQKTYWVKNLINSLPPNVYYLENSEIEIEGIKFWGSPITPWFGGHYWGFNKYRGEEIKKVWDQIPHGIDVIITHGPISYKLDYVPRNNDYTGCEDLRYKIKEIKPLLHCCGHIHEGYGIEGDEDTIYINAAIMDGYYNPTNKPWVVEITKDREVKVQDNE